MVDQKVKENLQKEDLFKMKEKQMIETINSVMDIKEKLDANKENLEGMIFLKQENKQLQQELEKRQNFIKDNEKKFRENMDDQSKQIIRLKTEIQELKQRNEN